MKYPDGDKVCQKAIKHDIQGVPTALKHVTDFSVCVQAGGNCGEYPLALAQRFELVKTFEPDAANYDCLLENCRLTTNIQATKAALSEKEGTSGLHRFPDNVGAHYLEGPGDIPVTTIDSLQLKSCGLIWLDVEGAEWLALKGGIETIKRCHPVIAIECKKHTHRFGYEQYELFEWLTLLGYFKEAPVFNDQVWTFAS